MIDEEPFDKRAGSFNPNVAIAQTIVDYTHTLIDNIDEQIKREEILTDGQRPWRKLNKASYHAQWSYWNDTANRRTRYGIRASTNKGHFERFLAYKNSDNSLDINWTINGFVPGTIHVTQAANEAHPSIQFIDYPLVPFGTLVSMLLGYDGHTQRPELWQQRVFHILVSEAKWLDQLVTGKIWTNGEVKQLGAYTITYSNGNGTKTYNIQSKDGSMTAIYKDGELSKIIRESKNHSNKYRIEVYPFFGYKIEDRASLLLINYKKANDERIAKTLELEQELSLLRLLANGNPELHQRAAQLQAQLEKLQQGPRSAVTEDPNITHYELGYSLADIKAKTAHKRCLFGQSNLAALMAKTGMLYNNGTQADFFADIKLPTDAVLLPWLGSVNDCMLTNMDGKPIELSRFGDRRLRRQAISLEQEEPAIYNIEQFAAYLKILGVNVVTDPSLIKAVYRWGIKRSAAELATKGIFYVAPNTVYLVDLGAKQNWSDLDIKKMCGNQIGTQKFQSYPHKEFLRQALSREMSKGDGISSEDDLAKVLRAMDFNVPDIVATERFLLDKLKHRQVNDPVLQFLDARVKDAESMHITKAKYRMTLGLRVAMRILADRGCTDIRLVHRLKPGTQVKAPGVPHLAYCNQGQSFLGSVDISGQLLDEKRDNLNKHIEALRADFKPVILSLKDFDHAVRDAHLYIGE